jgi:hypothetical protein
MQAGFKGKLSFRSGTGIPGYTGYCPGPECLPLTIKHSAQRTGAPLCPLASLEGVLAREGLPSRPCWAPHKPWWHHVHVTMNNRAGKVCDSDTRNALCDATDVCNRQSYYTATFTAAPRDYRQSPARVKGISTSHDLALAPLSSHSMYAASIGTKPQTAADALASTVGVSPTLVLSEQARTLNRVRGAVSLPSRVPVTGQGDVVGFSTTYKCAP